MFCVSSYSCTEYPFIVIISIRMFLRNHWILIEIPCEGADENLRPRAVFEG